MIKKTFTCAEIGCLKSYDLLQSLTYHLFKNHDKLKYKTVFEKTKSKKKQKSFNCPECEKKLSSSLARHMRLKHSILNWVPEIPIYLTTKVKLPKLKKIKNQSHLN